MSLNVTHTYARLSVSKSTFGEIFRKLRKSGYQDQIHDDGDGTLIDMHGIALVVGKRKKVKKH